MSRTSRKIAIFVMPVFATLLLNARERTDKIPDATVLGCLAQGDQPNQYVIKADAKTYVLTGPKANMAKKHVGQQVSVSGSIKKEGDLDRLKVSFLSKVSNNCQ